MSSMSIMAKTISGKIFDVIFEQKDTPKDVINEALHSRRCPRIGSLTKEPLISKYEIQDVEVGDTIAIITGPLWSYTLLLVKDVTKYEISGFSIRPNHDAVQRNQLQFFAKLDLRLGRNPMNHRWTENGFIIHEKDLSNLLNNMSRKLQFCEDVRNPTRKAKLYAYIMRGTLRKSIRQ